MESDETQIVIGRDGRLRFMYDDRLLSLAEQGLCTTRRASHVEPCSGGWQADLGPVGGPVLGPFRERGKALEAERDWLFENNVPVPVEP